MAESYEEHIPCTRQVKVSQSQLSRLSLTPVPAHIHIILFFLSPKTQTCLFICYFPLFYLLFCAQYCRLFFSLFFLPNLCFFSACLLIIEDVTGPVDINTCNTLRPCVPASQEAYAKRKWAF